MQTQKVYGHGGGTHIPLDHDTDLQPCIRKAPAIFQIACTQDTFPNVLEIMGFEKHGYEMGQGKTLAHCIRKSNTDQFLLLLTLCLPIQPPVKMLLSLLIMNSLGATAVKNARGLSITKPGNILQRYKEVSFLPFWH